MKYLHVLLCLFSILALSACGGGGSDDGDSSVSGCGTVVDIGPNSIINGMLEAGDCLMSDLDSTAPDDTSFADEYRITLDSMGTLTISLKSVDFDSLLALLDRSTSCSSGCTPAQAMVIIADDDSGGGVNGEDALISMDLAAGTYMIAVNSWLPKTGSYTLETSF